MKNNKTDYQQNPYIEPRIIRQVLDKVIAKSKQILYADDEIFIKNMETRNLGGDDISRYRFWEWPQGVGLLGFWKLFETFKDAEYIDLLIRYFERQLQIGLPSKNINTSAPMLTLAFLYEYSGEKKYGDICAEWAQWMIEHLPKTKESGFQHITSDTLNNNELWVDTLFMAVLFLAKAGRIFNHTEWIEEAKYQFLLHIKYLIDRKSGLWFHGWTFDGGHNFSGALWGRGNGWVTIAIPEFLSIADCEPGIRRFLIETLNRQIEALEKYQDPVGMWHTLIDDTTSYLESSATCGISYGILRAVNMGLVDAEYKKCALKAVKPIIECIDDNGCVGRVSYGTCMGRESLKHYKEIEIKAMPYGQALAIMFLLEALK
jgi:unsaturated rhamnogalacturonyl hydrolase